MQFQSVKYLKILLPQDILLANAQKCGRWDVGQNGELSPAVMGRTPSQDSKPGIIMSALAIFLSIPRLSPLVVRKYALSLCILRSSIALL